MLPQLIRPSGVASSSGLQDGRPPRRRRKERYQLLELIGEGAMGRVFRALDRELNRTVAVKVLRRELASSLRHIMQLKREVILASRVQDPHVVRVHDLGEAEGQLLVAMDWVDGENLAALLFREHCLAPSQVCNLATQICQALLAIHSAGIIHRDLKPGNLLIDKHGEILVTDFGLARSVLAGDLTLSTSGEKGGTPRYMAPEQVAGLPADARSDLYSLGLVLLEMLTGTTALETLEPLRTRIVLSKAEKRLRSGELRKLSVLDRVVRRCLQLDRSQRYDGAAELLRDLAEPHEVPEGPRTPAPSLRTVARSLGGRKLILSFAGRILLGVFGTALLGLILWAIVSLIIHPTSSPSLSREANSQQLYATAIGHMTPRSTEPDLRIAVQALDRAVEYRPDNLLAHRARTEALIRLFETTEDPQLLTRAGSALQQATASALGHRERVVFQARIDLDSGRPQAVIQNLQPLWKDLGASAEPNRLLARALEASGQLDRAMPYYQKAVRLDPESWLCHNELGSALLKAGHLAEARQQFTSVTRLNPDASTGYCNLGVALLSAGDFTGARANFEAALERRPSAEVYSNLGVAAYYSGQYATSIPFLETAIKMRPSSTKYIAELADALWYSGQREQARETCDRLTFMFEKLSATGALSIAESCRRARCLARLGDLAGAYAALENVARADPNDQMVLYTYAVLALLAHHPIESKQCLTEAIRRGYSAALARVDPDLPIRWR
jgi:serine/threonine-protein kinase